MTEPRTGADCRACRATTVHERINPVSRGMDYWRCCACGTVIHVPKQQETETETA